MFVQTEKWVSDSFPKHKFKKQEHFEEDLGMFKVRLKEIVLREFGKMIVWFHKKHGNGILMARQRLMGRLKRVFERVHGNIRTGEE